MEPLYQLKITKSLDGRGASKTWSNTYNFETGYALDSAEMRAYVGSRVAAERSGHYDDVYFLTAYVRRLPHTPTENTGRSFLSISINGNGERVNESQLMPLNIVLVVKRTATLDRSGRIEYRGALAVADLDFTPSGGYRLKDISGIPGAQYGHQPLINALNTPAQGFRTVMPDDSGSFTDYSRPIINYGFAEVSKRQEKTSRKTPEYNHYNGAAQEVRALKKQMKEILAGGPLSAVDGEYLPAFQQAANRIKEILDALQPKYALKIIKEETLKALPGGESV